ncbi:hypothetical protein BJV74DRAFT_824352 [Russula compacta]|nr:hypothetical protein BJV74DRAFT_824352 [Russula compacta]
MYLWGYRLMPPPVLFHTVKQHPKVHSPLRHTLLLEPHLPHYHTPQHPLCVARPLPCTNPSPGCSSTSKFRGRVTAQGREQRGAINDTRIAVRQRRRPWVGARGLAGASSVKSSQKVVEKHSFQRIFIFSDVLHAFRAYSVNRHIDHP